MRIFGESFVHQAGINENELKFDVIHDIGKVKFDPCEYPYENMIDYWRKSKELDHETEYYSRNLRFHGATSGTSHVSMHGFAKMDKKWSLNQMDGLGERFIAVNCWL